MAKVLYASIDDIKLATNKNTGTKNDKVILRALASASDLVEAMTHRRFYPEFTSQYLSGSDFFITPSGTLYLESLDVISVSELIINGKVVSSDDYFVSQAPMDANDFQGSQINIEPDDDILITGCFGYTNRDVLVTELTANVLAADTYINVTDSSAISVGHTLRIDEEYMRVTAKSQLISGQTLINTLTAEMKSTIVTVADASSFHVDETLLIDGERVRILDIAGNNLIVDRAQEGSVLAAHTIGATIYVGRRLKVLRGLLGTTAADYSVGEDVFRFLPPSLVVSLCIAETINIIEQQSSAYARVIGEGQNLRESSGRGLSDVRKQAMTAYRKYRMGSV